MSAFNKTGKVHAPDFKWTGDEPDWHNWESWPIEKFYKQRSRALNFYNYYLGVSDLKPIIIAWMKKEKYSKEQITDIKEAGSNIILSTAGKLIRCMDLGMPPLHPEAQTYFDNLPFHETPPIAKSDYDVVKLEIKNALLSIGNNTVSSDISVAISKAKGISPIDRIRENVRKDIIVSLDELIDRWCDLSSGVATINMSALLKENKVPIQGCKQISDWLETHKAEYSDALEKTCEQAVESYSYLSKPNLKKIVTCFDVMINDVRMYSKTKLSARKPRVKKTKDATKQVSKIKYQLNSAEYQLDSISPMRIPGSQRLFVFNTKDRKLTVFFAKGSPGLEVKGSSIHSWNPEESFVITLRKPADIITKLLSVPPKKIDNVLESIKAVRKKANGRINANCIFLKVLDGKI